MRAGLSFAVLVLQRYTEERVFLFANSKCKYYFHNRLKPAKLTWTAMYRRQHKKLSGKRHHTTKKPYSRSILGATLEVIQKRRTEKAEVCDAAWEAALQKTKDEKKAKQAELMAKAQRQPRQRGSGPKATRGPKLGGGGGKR
ncbi:60S ribosomal protein [Musa troglodytarum]|uniref:60S ribosomal protein n=1 Tax=Musa troglodytarum TaxID=320322 RepID=A0A9E7G5R7_9LILI|nr:60S ribosomal protein [Musa troglodytarum]